MGKFIPLSVPNFEGNERKYVDDAIDQGWVSTGGAYITQLEKKLAEFLRTENVAACQSGTSALHLSLVEAGVKPGPEMGGILQQMLEEVLAEPDHNNREYLLGNFLRRITDSKDTLVLTNG